MNLRTTGAIRTALAALPPTLDKTYEDILLRIYPEDKALAKEVLQLLGFSLRPLTLNEICEALQITAGLPYLDESKLLLNPKDVIGLCGGLVDFDENTGIVSLAHHSVKTYLMDSDLKGSVSHFRLFDDQANRVLVEMCLTYLSFDAFSGGPCESKTSLSNRMQSFPFLDYAAHHWALHAQRLSNLDSSPGEAMGTFFTDSNSERENFSAWVQVLVPQLPVTRIKGIPPLYYAASFGLTTAVLYLLDAGADIEAHGGRHGATPLGIASFRGHADVVKILLDRGADPYARDHRPGWNAIDWACHFGHKDVIEVIDACAKRAVGAHR